MRIRLSVQLQCLRIRRGLIVIFRHCQCSSPLDRRMLDWFQTLARVSDVQDSSWFTPLFLTTVFEIVEWVSRSTLPRSLQRKEVRIGSIYLPDRYIEFLDHRS